LNSSLGIKLKYAARLQFNAEADKCSNNIDEYDAVLIGLHKLRAMGVQLQFNEKEYIARDETLERYLAAV
jgi:ribonuclease HI